MTKDIFRALQKRQCPFSYGKNVKKYKQSIYGCSCCMGLPLNLFKKVARKKARKRLSKYDKQSDFDTKDSY